MSDQLGINLSRWRDNREETTTYETAVVLAWTASGNNTLDRNAETILNAVSLDGANYAAGDVLALLKFKTSHLVLGKLA